MLMALETLFLKTNLLHWHYSVLSLVQQDLLEANVLHYHILLSKIALLRQ